MFTEIKGLKNAKKYLKLKYELTSNKELSNIKYNHLVDCLNILKFYNLLNYLNYGQAVLLHDVGRFYETDSKNKKFDHAKYGYKLLKKEFDKNPIVLLPIKYHEEDLKWEKLLYKDIEFLNCTKKQKRKIIKCCRIVRDIDIISNMKNIIEQKLKNENIDYINEKIINKLYIGNIGIKEDIYNGYDEISYILCGLNLLSFSKSFKYLKKNRILEQLKTKQLMMVENRKKLYDSTVEMYNFIQEKYKL